MRLVEQPKWLVPVDSLIYVLLVLLFASSLWNGPVAKLRSGETRMVSSDPETLDLPPRPLPTISICRMQNFVLDTHGTGDSMLEGTTYGINKLKNQILNFLEYFSLLFRDLHEYFVSSGLIDPLFVSPAHLPFDINSFNRVLGDNLSTGDCHIIYLEGVEGAREVLGQLGPNGVVFFNLREDDLPQGQRAQYVLNVYERNDHISAGTNIRSKAERSTVSVNQGTGYMYTVSTEVQALIKDCEEDQELWPLSKCMSSAVSRELQLECGSEEDGLWFLEGCNPAEKYRILHLVSYIKLSVDDLVREKSGCITPCRRTIYSIDEVLALPTIRDGRELRDKRLEVAQDENTTLVSFQLRPDSQTKFSTEVTSYDASDLVADLGGLVGFFLGISF